MPASCLTLLYRYDDINVPNVILVGLHMKITYRLLLAALLLVSRLPAHAYGHIEKDIVSVRPSDVDIPKTKNYIVFEFLCVDVRTGRYVDCAVSQEITGLVDPAADVANNGGHTHDYETHPLGTLSFLPSTAKSRTVTGSTRNSVAKIKYEVPDVGGLIMVKSTMTVPPGWFCVSPSYDAVTWRFEDTVDVGMDGLEYLPASPDGTYRMTRNPDTRHTDANAFFGTPSTNMRLGEIATTYFARSGRILSINDMSLPRGGLFDVGGTWTPPHNKHRIGESADINQDGVSCFKDRHLEIAVSWIVFDDAQPGNNVRARSTLLCESGGRKHIDF